MRDTPVFVLDSFALLALFHGEPGMDAVADLLGRARRAEVRLVMSVVNLGEVIYRTIREDSVERAQEILGLISNYEIELRSIDQELALAGAVLKGAYAVSYADCLAAALAQDLQAPVVTGDPDFRRLEGVVTIEWLPGTPPRKRRTPQ